MKRRDGSEPARAAVLANKDSKTKKAQKEVADTSSDSDVETALTQAYSRGKEKKRQGTQADIAGKWVFGTPACRCSSKAKS